MDLYVLAMAEINDITNTVEEMTCIHGIHKVLHFYVFMRQFLTVVEHVTVSCTTPNYSWRD